MRPFNHSNFSNFQIFSFRRSKFSLAPLSSKTQNACTLRTSLVFESDMVFNVPHFDVHNDMHILNAMNVPHSASDEHSVSEGFLMVIVASTMSL